MIRFQPHPNSKTGESVIIGYSCLPRFVSVAGLDAQREAMVTASPGNTGTELEAFGFALLGELTPGETRIQQERDDDSGGAGVPYPSCAHAAN